MNAGKKQPLIAVAGPTAAGKTAVGVALAKEYNGEVISADSMQIYKGLDITTAKPSEAEKDGVPHHLMGFMEMREAFSVADYVKLAKEKIEEIAAKGKIPVIVGGTGLYIDSLLNGISFDDTAGNRGVRARLTEESGIIGNDGMHKRLAAADPEAAKSIHPNNLPRVIRALEVIETTGVKFSEYKRINRAAQSPYNACIIGLDFENRQDLYDRINARVDRMLEQGMLPECKEAYETAKKLSSRALTGTAEQAIGYKELNPFFEGREELTACVDKIKQNTRRYAKRQLTWFRRNNQINWIYLCNNIIFEKITDSCKKIVAKSEIL